MYFKKNRNDLIDLPSVTDHLILKGFKPNEPLLFERVSR